MSKCFRKHPCLGFTLLELIVVIVVMTILASITGLAFRRIAADLRMSSAISTLSASLDNARALAIKKNRYVLATFVPRLIKDRTEQVTDIIIAEWNGETTIANFDDDGGIDLKTVDRFVPIQGIEVRSLEEGVNVAGPSYQSQNTGDDVWLVPTYLPEVATVNNNTDLWGRVSAVMYSPEGRVVVRNSKSNAYRTWVDFNLDGEQTYDPDPDRNPNTDDAVNVGWLTGNPIVEDEHYSSMRWLWGVYMKGDGAEPFVNQIPLLTVFDEREFYTLYSSEDWTEWYHRENDYTEFISGSVSPIQFNRYSGVIMK
jgi:prepilin-type N-terminal cleavage/methylation domain-containing protein